MNKKQSRTVNDAYDFYMGSVEPDLPAIHFNDQTITYGEFNKNINLYIKHLIQMGVRQGSRVGYTLPNCPEVFYLFFAISRLGACSIPLFHMIPDISKANTFKNLRAEFVITNSQLLGSLKESTKMIEAHYKISSLDEHPYSDYDFSISVEDSINIDTFILKKTELDLPLLIASSSGTTGIPKYVIMTQSNVASVFYASIDMVMPFFKGEYCAAMAFPFSTSVIVVCAGTLLSGARMVFSDDLSPVKFLQLVSKWKPDSMSAPPAYYEAILSLPMIDKFDLSNIRRVYTGMDFMSPSLLTRLKSKFVNINTAVSGYGLIETATVFMHWKEINVDEMSSPMNVMKLVEGNGNFIDVRDEHGNSVPPGAQGELYVKGDSVVGEYLDNIEETEKSFFDGWFRTGDIVRNEGNNAVTLLGRKKYLIKRGGKSVSPIVVQDQINKLEGVKVSAVVGIPHQLYGEMVWAFIVKNNGSEVTLKDVMKRCREELPNYMVPDQITFIEEIPKVPGVGKVNYERMKELAKKELEMIEGGSNG